MSKIYPIGRVYAIRSPNTEKIYVGSTFNPISKRFGQHKMDCKKNKEGKTHYKTSYKIIEAGDAYIELLEQYENLNREQLLKNEGEYIRKNRDFCVNRCIAGRSREDYKNENRELINAKAQIYKKKNHDVIKEKYREARNEVINCECGGKYKKPDKSVHFKTKIHQNFVNPK